LPVLHRVFSASVRWADQRSGTKSERQPTIVGAERDKHPNSNSLIY
jgi:hypothetical protein